MSSDVFGLRKFNSIVLPHIFWKDLRQKLRIHKAKYSSSCETLDIKYKLSQDSVFM